MRTLGLDVKYALRSNLQRPWLAAPHRADALARARRECRRPGDGRCPDRPAVPVPRCGPHPAAVRQRPRFRVPPRAGGAGEFPRLEAPERPDSAPVGVLLVGCQPGWPRRAGTGARLPRVRGFLPGARRAAGARPRIPGRRGNARPPPPRRHRPWAVAAALRWRPGPSSDARSRWTPSRTKSSASRRRGSTSPWARRCGRPSRSMRMRQRSAPTATSP